MLYVAIMLLAIIRPIAPTGYNKIQQTIASYAIHHKMYTCNSFTKVEQRLLNMLRLVLKIVFKVVTGHRKLKGCCKKSSL